MLCESPDWPAVLSAQICELLESEEEGLTVVSVKHRIPHGERFTVREVQVELDELVRHGCIRHDGETYGRKYFMD